MQSVSIHKASDLRPDVRSAVEELLGRPIQADEEVSVIATPPQQAPPRGDRVAITRRLQTFLQRRAQKIQDVSDHQMDSIIDEAIEHARHTRR